MEEKKILFRLCVIENLLTEVQENFDIFKIINISLCRRKWRKKNLMFRKSSFLSIRDMNV